MSYFFLLYQSLFSSLYTVFYSISSDIDEFLLINLSANVFVFRDFNMHHKDLLTYSGGTDWPGKFCYNFSISNDLTQVINFPTRIPDCNPHSPALLDWFLSPDASICSTMTFAPLGNSDHLGISVSIDFPLNSQWDASFHRIAYDYSLLWLLIGMVFMIIWEMVHGRISLNLVLLLLLVNFVSRFRLELMYISLIENIRSSLTYLHGFQLLVLLP